MTKTPISLQDLRRRIYVKAKTEPSWRFGATASVGSGGVVGGCTGSSGSLETTECGTADRRKLLQLDRSHNPWREACRSA